VRPSPRVAAFAGAALLVSGCAVQTKTQEVVVTRSPHHAAVRYRPEARVVERRKGSEVVELTYHRQSPARWALIGGGALGVVAGTVGILAGIVAEAVEDDGIVTDPNPTDSGLVGEAIIIGGVVVLAAGVAALVVGASAEPTIIDATYRIEATADGYSPLRAEIVVPRAKYDWVELELVPTSTAIIPR
jgi:hypothetical protein